MTNKGQHTVHGWILVLGILISVIISGAFYLSLNRQAAADIARMHTIFTERTENVLSNTFHKTDVLAVVVKLRNGNIDETVFHDVAKSVYKEGSGIRGIQYMPGAVVTYSYPIEGNEPVIGKNFFNIPERRNDVLLAIDTKSIALSGPYHLIQGGLGVVARNPVFLTDSNGHEYFWGFSAIILDLPDAIQSVGLNELLNQGYDYQLYCVNENNERIIIDGNPDLDMSHAVLGDIQVPHHVWTLAIVEQNPWMNAAKAGIILLLGILISSIIWLEYRLILQKQAGIREKEQFFADISHDMRTPLNGVIGYTDLAREASSLDVIHDYLDKLYISGQMLLQLINDTLDFSKLESNKIILKTEPVRMCDVCKTIDVIIRPLADAKHLDFHLKRTSSYDGFIEADSLRIRQIFVNLLSNAVKFTPEGGKVEATVTEIEREDMVDITIVIRDTGIGMSQAFLPKIFDAYAQEEREAVSKTVGTGLGMAIVKQIVTLCQGTITVKSEIEKGTTFTVALQFHKAQGALEAVVNTRDEAKRLQGKRVLLFEDNGLNAEITQLFLEKHGMDVTIAVNGKEGLDIFTQAVPGTFACILMDKRMPVMNGVEATRAIRLLDREDAATIPIIAMTGDVDDSSIQECLAVGMNAHVGKPINREELFAMLCKWIS